MKCPKCGYVRQSRDDAFAPPTECPACGIVYVKYEPGGSDSSENTQAAVPLPKKPSAVDESTLRKARERVERRLRKKTSAQGVQDEERERMLKQARILAAEGVRKRQQEWQQRQATETVETESTQTSLSAEVDAAFQETGGAEAINPADRQVFTPVAEVKANDPGLFLDDTQPAISPASSPSEPEPELKLDDTISEEPLLIESTTPQPTAPALEPETPAQSPLEEEPAMEESNVIAIGARAVQTQENLMADSIASQSEDQAKIQPEPLAADDQPFPRARTTGLMRFFQAVAWLILVAGLGGAVLSWITLTDVQAGTQAAGPMNAAGTLPMALLLAFAYLAIGVLGFAFFWVTSLIGGQLAEIRGILLRGSQAD
jgi:hypothetical protein